MELRGIKGAAIGICAIAAVISLGLFVPDGWWRSKPFWVIVSTSAVFGDLLYKRRWLIVERRSVLLAVLVAGHLAAWLALLTWLYPPNGSNSSAFIAILLFEALFLPWMFASEPNSAAR
jgi:hypothetical protein